MKNQKGFASIVLIAALVILIGVVSYVAWRAKSIVPVVNEVQNTNNPEILVAQIDTSNWKTYTNAKYNYEIKYPESAQIKIATKETELTLQPKDSEPLYFSVIPNTTIENNVTKTNTTIDGVVTIGSIEWTEKHLDLENAEGTFQHTLETKNGNYTYSVNLNDRAELTPLEKEILSTFKFIEPTTKPDIQAFSTCLPSGIKLTDVVTVGTSVKQKLTALKAKCVSGKLVDATNKQITFYHLQGCWGNPPVNYREIEDKQQQELTALKAKYTVIEMTCNPTGALIQ